MFVIPVFFIEIFWRTHLKIWTPRKKSKENVLISFKHIVFTDKLASQKDTYNAICADMDIAFAEMAGF